eukprot:5104143-Heterocapsa_arctica.AAC.1
MVDMSLSGSVRHSASWPCSCHHAVSKLSGAHQYSNNFTSRWPWITSISHSNASISQTAPATLRATWTGK